MSVTIRKLAGSEDELHAAAIRESGFDDFGDSAYRRGLRVLLEALDNDLQLTEKGRQNAHRVIVESLIARLYAQKGWTEHPQVLEIPIRCPVVIVGLPRTGTTALHKLLSIDPQFQGLELWLARTPMSRPPRETWDIYSGYRTCVADFEAIYTQIPELRRVHELTAGEVAECTNILLTTFASTIWAAQGLPTYGHWLVSQNASVSYRWYVDVLRLIGAREPHKRWLLKNPYHMAEIGALLDVFPDACIIQTHRDPLESIPSFCNLFYTSKWLETEAARADILGPRECVYWGKALEQMQAARQSIPMGVCDVDQRRFVEDPLGTVRSIYDYFSLTLSTRTEQLMRAWSAANRTSRQSRRQDDLGSWGITSAYIRETFSNYRAQHGFE